MAAAQSLTTQRLGLRPAAPTDSGFVGTLLQDAQVREFLGGPVAADQVTQAVRGSITPSVREEIWIAEAPADLHPLGLISLGPHKDGFEVEISYQFHPQTWGQGFAAEALRAVLSHARDTRGHRRVIAETQRANHRSIRLLRRLGMREVERLMRYGAAQTIYAT